MGTVSLRNTAVSPFRDHSVERCVCQRREQMDTPTLTEYVLFSQLVTLAITRSLDPSIGFVRERYF